MTKYHRTYIAALRQIFFRKIYILLFLIFAVLMMSFLVYLPIFTVPGNTLNYQLSFYKPEDFVLLLVLSGLTALSLVFNIFLFTQKNKFKVSLAILGQSGTGLLSGIIASLFATATCTACVLTFFGFLGIGGVVFLMDYREQISVVAIIVLVISLYFTSQRVLGVCKSCKF